MTTGGVPHSVTRSDLRSQGSRPVLALIDDVQVPEPAVATGIAPRRTGTAPSADARRLVAALELATVEVENLAFGVQRAHSDLRAFREALRDADASRQAFARRVVRGAISLVVACLLVVLWWRPQWFGHLPRIMPLVAGRVSDNDVLLGLLLPGGSVAVVLLVTLCLRLGWRRGLEITEP